MIISIIMSTEYDEPISHPVEVILFMNLLSVYEPCEEVRILVKYESNQSEIKNSLSRRTFIIYDRTQHYLQI